MDIGGTNFRFSFESEELCEDGFFATDRSFLTKIDELISRFKPQRLGASFAGQVCNGKIISAPNISTNEIYFEKYFTDKYSIECKIDNDLKCAILAEAFVRPDVESLVLLYVGTGFGSAYMDRGNIIRGISNTAGEIGHIPFKKSDRICGCGKNNCLELFCSGTALQNRMKDLGYDKAILSDMLISDDESVKKIVDDFHDGLLYAVGVVLSLLNPSVIVFGGGIMQNNPNLLDFIEQNRNIFFKNATKSVRFELSSFVDGSMEGAKKLFD